MPARTFVGGILSLAVSFAGVLGAHLAPTAATNTGRAVSTQGAPVAGALLAPPRSAVPSAAAVRPFMTIGSPYLRVRVRSYRAPLTPQALYRYYRQRLLAAGYALASRAQSCDGQGVCTQGWSFCRGRKLTAVLTVGRSSASGRRYSVAMEQIVPPPRPAGSVVPHVVHAAVVSARASASKPWRSRTLTGSSSVARYLRIVDQLPVDTRGVHGCAADFGARAIVRFVGAQRTWTFRENPACTSVAGPAGAQLFDGRLRLWSTVRATLDMQASGG